MAQPAPPSNPFDGFDAFGSVAQQPPSPQTQQQQPANPWGQSPPQQQQQPQTAVSAAANPFGGSFSGQANLGAVPPQGPPQPRASFAGQPTQPPAPMAPPQPQQVGMGFPQQQPPMSPQQPHPVPPQQQPHQQQIVPVAPHATHSPWALQSLQPQQQPVGGGAIVPVAAPAAGGQSYDPFGVFNAPSVPPPQQQQPIQSSPFNAQLQQQMQPHQEQQNPYALDPYQQQPTAQAPTTQQKLTDEMQHFNIGGAPSASFPLGEEDDEALALIDVELDDDGAAGDAEKLEERKRDGEFLSRDREASGGAGRKDRPGQRNSWDRNPDIAPPPPLTPGRRHSEYLAEHSAPALSSPLPRPELVHHAGYVLSRISFRTVLMRKWKQTFWIQYGPTQLLFFRTFADYEDWLNNPYHTLKAREFLVKLRVDFVSDLKKSSVMGYQVTQVRRKPYGKNVMLHFKLERWMDYGPTIAAAFAAREEEMMNSPQNRNRDADGNMNTANDVSSLRKIILGCMRNARDAAAAASRGERLDMGEAVGMRGRYDAEHRRETRVPTSSGNMGYHQAFSAERSERRRMAAPMDNASDVGTEESQEEPGAKREAEAPPPMIDLLG